MTTSRETTVAPAAATTPAARTAADAAAGGLVLALSVHGDDCSVALGDAGGATVELWSRQPERAQAPARPALLQGPLASRDALALLDRLLARTGIPLAAVERLAFAHGPGAFTSLRVAAGLVQGLGFALERPVAGVCSFAAMAAQAPGWQLSDAAWLQLGALDARMGECYYAVHRCRAGRYPEVVAAPAVGTAAQAIAVFEQVAGAGETVVAAGNGFAALPALAQWAAAAGLDAAAAGLRAPTADAVLALACLPDAPPVGPAEAALPVYVRDKVALDVDEQRQRGLARAGETVKE